MKKHKKLHAKRKQKFMAYCRIAGSKCYNPFCAFGCMK